MSHGEAVAIGCVVEAHLATLWAIYLKKILRLF